MSVDSGSGTWDAAKQVCSVLTVDGVLEAFFHRNFSKAIYKSLNSYLSGNLVRIFHRNLMRYIDFIVQGKFTSPSGEDL